MTDYAIGSLLPNHDYSEYWEPTYPAHATDYVQTNYVIIGGRDLEVEHTSYSAYSSNPNPDYYGIKLNSGQYIFGNGDWNNRLPLHKSVYTFNCQSVGSYFANDRFIPDGGTDYPLTGIEVYFSKHPNTPVNSNYSYSGVMEILEVRYSLDEGSWDSPYRDVYEFVGIVDMDMPSALLLENFDTYISKVRYGVYNNRNDAKMVINGVVVKTGKAARYVTYGANNASKYPRSCSTSMTRGYAARTAYSNGTSKQFYADVLLGKQPITVEGMWVNDLFTDENFTITAEISTYNCKYLLLTKGVNYGFSTANTFVHVGGIVSSNYQNSMPSLIIS